MDVGTKEIFKRVAGQETKLVDKDRKSREGEGKEEENEDGKGRVVFLPAD